MNDVPKPAKIGTFTSLSLVVASMVGTGVFTSLGFQLVSVTQPLSILLLWFLGGIFALCGAMCYAELAGALPRSGGEYHFLGRIYHPALGFMAGIVSLIAGFSAPVALAGLAFGTYLAAVFPNLPPVETAIGLVTIVTAFHLINLSASSAFQVFFTTLKIFLVLGLASAGFFLGHAPALSWSFTASVWKEMTNPSFAVSLMFALYAYSGWNAATYIIGEVHNPQRTIGLALLLGTGLVMLLYLFLNASFLLAAPIPALREQLDVGRVAGGFLFGAFGGHIVAILIAIGLISCVSAMTWIGPRVAMVMGEDLPALRFLSRRTQGGIPLQAVLLQYSVVVLLLATGSFETVLIYTQVALITCSALAIYGVIHLRIKEPTLRRPFLCWCYPFPPLLFLGISGFTIFYSVLHRPLESAAGLLTMILATISYFLIPKKQHDIL